MSEKRNQNQIKRKKRRVSKNVRIASDVWSALRPVCVFFVSLSIVIGMVYFAVDFAYDNYISPVEKGEISGEDDPSYVTVTIKSGSTVSGIARQLKEEGIIRNKAVFQYTAEFLSKGPKLQAGTFRLSPKMTINEIIETLSTLKASQATMRFTIIEGADIETMAESLVAQGALGDKTRFLELCKTGEAFADEYSFVKEAYVAAGPDRKYVLEGYLFPDTYEIYVGSSEETIIKKMLNRMDDMLSLAKAHQEDAGAMSIDDIVTLASMIEKEAKRADFARVSAVFHNRLEEGMMLQSDVTVQYITGSNKLVLDSGETSVDSDYNTYLRKGLPEGPVCCPSQYAIEAALYPDESYLDEYYYFCAGDPQEGNIVFAKTMEKHNENVEKYRPLWIEYDKQNAE
ncbi:MAG: endolytic transglycosylase MltG [Clostridiales bacterium]|nr:endolytic transglycosylase MltG [Clostridiales bacterium]